MIPSLFQYLQKPELYAKSTFTFWDDEHVSKDLLEAHLDPNVEAASRSHDFIDSSVQWLTTIAPPSTYKKLLDVGCGPGLYAERLANYGYQVTGIDFSKRSIAYGKNRAVEKNQEITYIYQNYLEMDFVEEFDVIIFIYCDYGVLSDENKTLILKKIHRALKPGGKLIFDVFTEQEFIDKKETSTWYVTDGSCFWKPHQHLCLQSHFIYEEEHVRLNQHVIIDKDEKIDVFRDWHKLFTKETIAAEVQNAFFHKLDIYSDVSGKPFNEASKTICVVAEKQI